MGISLQDLSPKAREQVTIKMAIEQARKMQKPSKYHAKKVDGCLVDGTPHTFDSAKEADRYAELAMMQRAGQISDLKVQVPFELIPKQKTSNGKTLRPVIYIADFTYTKNGEMVVEDVKGYKDTASAAYAKYVIKSKLMKWVHNIEISEI